MKNEEKALDIANKQKKYYGNPQYEMRDENWSVHECYQSAMQAMQWKDSQCLGSLLRVFDLIANKRDAGEALEYIKETLYFIIKDHYGDVDKNKANKMIMKSYCNLICIGNSENCISLAPCKEYNNIIHIFHEIDSKEE